MDQIAQTKIQQAQINQTTVQQDQHHIFDPQDQKQQIDPTFLTYFDLEFWDIIQIMGGVMLWE